jgi:hypothetical protein
MMTKLYGLVLPILCLALASCDSHDSHLSSRFEISPTGAADAVAVSAVPASSEPSAAISEESGTENPGKIPPKVISVSYSPSLFHSGIDLQLRPEVDHPAVDDVRFRYLWIINGEPFPWENEAVLSGDRFKKGDHLAVEVVPYTWECEGSSFRTKEIVVPNAPPRIVSTPPELFLEKPYFYQVEALDPDDDELTFALAASPQGMVIDPHSGKISWKTVSSATGMQQVRIVARDGEGAEAVQKFTYSLPHTEQIQ